MHQALYVAKQGLMHPEQLPAAVLLLGIALYDCFSVSDACPLSLNIHPGRPPGPVHSAFRGQGV